jgi:methyl-accepting chemotaxis protein
MNFTAVISSLKEKKILFSIILITAAVIAQSLFSFRFSILKDESYRELSSIRSNNAFLNETYIHYMKWSVELIESAAENRAFTGELDRNKTDFGKWYFSFAGSRQYWDLPAECRDVFDKFGPADLGLINTARMMIGADSQKERLEIYRTQTKIQLKDIQDLFTRYIALNGKIAAEKEREISRYTVISNVMLVSLSALIIAIVAFLGYQIIRSVKRSIRSFSEQFGLLENGDLGTAISAGGDDEYGALVRRYNSFLAKISAVISKVKSEAERLSESSAGMSATVNMLNDTTRQRSAAAEEISASMENMTLEMKNISEATGSQSDSLTRLLTVIEELSESIRTVNSSVQASSATIHSIASDARAGEELLSRMKLNMDAVGKSSEEITGIVSIINEISDRINLLSLNAAIEAARAGDSGRGFAVVAGEITKLAAQTAESISSIECLVAKNKAETDTGVSRVAESVARIRKIMTGIGDVERMIDIIKAMTEKQSGTNRIAADESGSVRKKDAEIRSAISIQNSSMQEMSSAFSDIAELTQKDSAAIQSIAENIGTLKLSAAGLFEQTNYFRTE